jgi:hypothetical protein
LFAAYLGPKDHFGADAQMIEVGRRYGSNEVALEGSETAARWKRDLTGLALYGHGQSAFDVFQADLAEHARLRAARPEAVAEKKMSVAARDEQFAQGWGWVRRVNSMLGVLARTDQSVATALNTAIPADDVGLEAGIRALAAILTEYQGHVAPDAHADKCLASVDALCTALQTSPGAVHTAKGHTVADTAQIDLYDGKLYLCMRDLNEAGRAAIRNGDLHASLHEYAFHHLKRSGTTNPVPLPAPTPAQAG